MLVELKEILNKYILISPLKLLVPIYTTYTQHTDLFLAQI